MHASHPISHEHGKRAIHTCMKRWRCVLLSTLRALALAAERWIRACVAAVQRCLKLEEGGCTGGRKWALWRRSCHARPFLVGQVSGLFKSVLSTASAGAVCVITCCRAGCTCRQGGQCPRGACASRLARLQARGAASHGRMRRGTVSPREWARGAAAPRAGGRRAPICVKSKPDKRPASATPTS